MTDWGNIASWVFGLTGTGLGLFNLIEARRPKRPVIAWDIHPLTMPPEYDGAPVALVATIQIRTRDEFRPTVLERIELLNPPTGRLNLQPVSDPNNENYAPTPMRQLIVPGGTSLEGHWPIAPRSEGLPPVAFLAIRIDATVGDFAQPTWLRLHFYKRSTEGFQGKIDLKRPFQIGAPYSQ